MFCEKCGAKLAEDARFCENCGSRVNDYSLKNGDKNSEKNHSNTLSIGRKVSKKQILILGLISVCVIAGIVMFVNRKTTINMSDYVSINFSGYDTIGTAQVNIDYDALEKDYGKKMKYDGSKKLEASLVETVDMFADECISGKLDKSEILTNGDTIVYKWDCDKELAKNDFNINLKTEDIKFIVSGLSEVKEIDPFENVEIIYSGTAPYGKASVNNKSNDEVLKELYFNIESSGSLSNGDKITVTLDDGWGDDIEQYYLSEYGIKFTSIEKEYTVDGLGSYVTKLSQIPEETLAKMKTQSEDVVKAQVAQSWDEHESLDAMTYIGSYLITPKDPKDNYGYSNAVYMVYKNTASDNFDEEDIHQSFTYYTYVAFTDIMVLPNGTCSLDLTDFSTPNTSFTRNIELGSNIWNYTTFYYYGYENLDTLFNNCITTKVDQYSYESSVTDIE